MVRQGTSSPAPLGAVGERQEEEPRVRVIIPEEPNPPLIGEGFYTRIAPHESPIHLDEYAAAALLRIFSEEADRIWPGSSTARFMPYNSSMDGPDVRGLLNDPRVLKLGWGGRSGEEFVNTVDEHRLPSEERRHHCTATLTANRLGLNSRQRFLIKDILADVLRSDKRDAGELGPLHLANLVKLPFNGETIQDRLKMVVEAFHNVMRRQERFLDGIAKLRPSAIWQIKYRNGWIEAHVFDDADGPELAPFEDVLTSVSYGTGADLVIIRTLDGRIQIIVNSNRKPPLSEDDIALGVRAFECKLRDRALPPLAELRRRGTIPEVPEWHYSDSGNILNGGQAQRWAPRTLVSLEQLQKILGHALDENWMKAKGFAA